MNKSDQEKLAELERLLDNYRGTCAQCGREGALLEDTGDYEGGKECLLDKDECRRLHRALIDEQLQRIEAARVRPMIYSNHYRGSRYR